MARFLKSVFYSRAVLFSLCAISWSKSALANPVALPPDITNQLTFLPVILFFGVVLPLIAEYFTIKKMFSHLFPLPEKLKRKFIFVHAFSYPAALFIYFSILDVGVSINHPKPEYWYVPNFRDYIVYITSIFCAEFAAVVIEWLFYRTYYLDIKQYGIRGWWCVIVANLVSAILGALFLIIIFKIFSITPYENILQFFFVRAIPGHSP